MIITCHWFTLFLSVINLFALQSEPICKVYKTTYVDCTGRELSNLPQNIPSYTTYLDLTYNKIASLPPNGFKGFKQLHSLILSSNRITHVDSTSLKGLKNLQDLWLSGNYIILTLNLFKDLSKLEILDLSYNNLTKIPNDLFSPLKYLKNLFLSNNHFLVLTFNFFHKLGNLQKLDLSSTGISILPDGIFERLANLKELYLRKNKMTRFPNKILQVLANIESIYFDYNEINPNCTDINLTNFRKLQMLSLSSCFMADDIIPNFIFADKEPHETDFAGTRNKSPQEETFYSENNETTFTISLFWNNINADSLERLLYGFKNSKIRELSLNSLGQLSTMTDSTLRGLKDTKLKILQFQRNPLSSLRSGVFQWLPFLEELSIVGESLSNISSHTFIGLASLKTFELSFTSLRVLPSGAFAPLKSLEELYLNENLFANLTELLHNMGRFSRLTHLELYNNKFSGIIPSNISTYLPSLRYLDIGGNDFIAIHPTSFSSLLQLEVLNISGNKVLNLHDKVFSLPSLQVLVINYSGKASLHLYSTHFLMDTKKLQVLYVSFITLTKMHVEDMPRLRALSVTDRTLQPLFLCNHFIVMYKILHSLAIHTFSLSAMCIDVEEHMQSSLFFTIERLYISNCTFKSYSSLYYFLRLFPNVKDLSIEEVPALTSINQIPQTNKLEQLRIVTTPITFFDTDFLGGQKNLMKVEILSGRFNCLHCNMKAFIDWMENDDMATLVLDYPICDIPNQMSIYNLQYGLECNQAFLISVPIVCVAVFLTVCILLAFRFRWHIRYVIFLGRMRCGGYKLQVNDDDQPLNKKYDAFVCYNEHDRDWVWQQLVPNLEDIDPPNFKLCLHERDFMPGTDIFENILDSIDNSHKTMLILSPHFAESEWCYFEMRMAQSCLFEEKRDVLILVLLEEIPDAVMPRVLSKILLTKRYITWVENKAGRRLFWKKLKLDLRSDNRFNRIADV